MTHDEIMALEGNALSAAVDIHIIGNPKFVEEPGVGQIAGPNWAYTPDGDGPYYDGPEYTTDLNHCVEMEEALSQPHREQYIVILYDLGAEERGHLDSWDLAHAPAPARCRAALLAVMGASE